MTFSIIYAVVALIFLLAVFLVTYRLGGKKLAIGLSIAAFLIFSVFYVVLVIMATSQM